MHDDAGQVFPLGIGSCAFERECLGNAKRAGGQHACHEAMVQWRLGASLLASPSDSDVVVVSDEADEHRPDHRGMDECMDGRGLARVNLIESMA